MSTVQQISESQGVKMSETVQLKGCICGLNFGYNAKMEGYTTLMSDIPKLSEIEPAAGKEQRAS